MSAFWTLKNSGDPGVSPFSRGSLSQISILWSADGGESGGGDQAPKRRAVEHGPLARAIPADGARARGRGRPRSLLQPRRDAVSGFTGAGSVGNLLGRHVPSPGGQNMDLGFSPRERCGLAAVCPGPIEPRRIRRHLRRGGRCALAGAQAPGVDGAGMDFPPGQRPGAVSAVAAGKLCRTGLSGLARGRAVPAQHARGVELPCARGFCIGWRKGVGTGFIPRTGA